jgi:acyl-CoA synthetase (NDP forming)
VTAAAAAGYPVVLKSGDPDLVHKSDTGGVRLDISNDDEVRDAFRAVTAAGRPGTGALVQRQISAPAELVAGLVHDPLFGSLVMLGLGGVHTDLLGDRTLRLVPLTDLDAERMWRNLRAAPLLTGYRGAQPVDTTALEDLLLRSQAAVGRPGMTNPGWARRSKPGFGPTGVTDRVSRRVAVALCRLGRVPRAPQARRRRSTPPRVVARPQDGSAAMLPPPQRT